MMTPLFNMASAMEKRKMLEVTKKWSLKIKENQQFLMKVGIQNQGEIVEVDGVTYKYEDSLDQDGNKITKITNTSTGEEDVLTFVDDEVLLNDEDFATIETTMEDEAPTSYKMNQWVNTGTYHKTIKRASNGEGYLVLGIMYHYLRLYTDMIGHLKLLVVRDEELIKYN